MFILNFLQLGSESRVGFHYGSAFFTRSQVFRVIEMFEMMQKIFFDIRKRKIDFVEFVVAVVAKPKQAIFCICSGAF